MHNNESIEMHNNESTEEIMERLARSQIEDEQSKSDREFDEMLEDAYWEREDETNADDYLDDIFFTHDFGMFVDMRFPEKPIKSITGVCSECQSEQPVIMIGSRYVMALHHAASIEGSNCEDMTTCLHYGCKGTYTTPETLC